MSDNLVTLVKELLSSETGRIALANHGFLPKPVAIPAPHITGEEIIAVLKLICAGAALACPIIDSLL